RAILEQHERETCFLRDLALAAERNYSQGEQEDVLNFQSARDDIKNKSQQEKQYTRLEVGGKLDELWLQFQEALQGYTEATEHQKVAFQVLKEKDRKHIKEKVAQGKKLQKLQDLVAATKSQIITHLRESKEQNQQMREEKEKALKELQELKNEMNQGRARAQSSLARLVLQSGAALKALGQLVEKAQRILRLAEMCRRLETEEEKVLPFYPSSLEEEEQQDAQRVLQETPEEPLAQARLEEQALEQERAGLALQHQQLRDVLGRYLAGISSSQEVLNNPNPLLTVHNKNCIPRGEGSRSGKD
ncbi:PREDICTED: coiled-coil domain-containing protein 65, partial [Chaetura pelagica]|uniref:coiled-coil domain-containing protein 65 n=1 Tax=Chaetura pelagica TaxID=8897 RepID=UPI00052311DE